MKWSNVIVSLVVWPACSAAKGAAINAGAYLVTGLIGFIEFILGSANSLKKTRLTNPRKEVPMRNTEQTTLGHPSADKGGALRRRKLALGFCLGLVAAFSGASSASDLSGVAVMALGPVDGRVVVRIDDGKMTVLKLGDAIEGTDARVVQVLADRLVLEDRVTRNSAEPVLETVWLYKADKSGRSSEERFSPEPPPQPVVEQPVDQSPRKN